MIIKIKNLRLKTIIGVYEWEKKILREIIINLEIEISNSLAIQSDNIEDTVDYDVIVEKIKNFIDNNHFSLIEKMVDSIANLIMEDNRIKKCKLEIDKIGAIKESDSVSVTVIKERK